MDVSLEEIIRKKKNVKKGKFPSRFIATKPPQRNGNFKAKPKLKIGDARMKIIQQNRTKLVDARDKLAQLAKKTDARLKLLKIRKQHVSPLAKRPQNIGNSRFTLSTNRSGQISLSSKKDIARIPAQLQRSIKNDLVASALPLHRTIRNDVISPLSRMPPLPDIAPVWEPAVYHDVGQVRHGEPVIPRDLSMRITVKQSNISAQSRNPVRPMDESDDDDGDVRMGSPMRSSYPPAALSRPRVPRGYSPPAPPRHLQQSSARAYYRPAPRPRPRTPAVDLVDSVHSRLDVSPPPVRSMGIFAAGRGGGGGGSRGMTSMSRIRQHPAPQQQPSQGYNSHQGYRIVVSNLQSNVTQEDIKELFEDVGELLESRLVRPGTAEVIFKTLSDAQQAVDVYHNRQLDGQPMKCLLVNPRQGNKPTAPALKPVRTPHGTSRKMPTKSSVEPDIDTFHSVMFKRQKRDMIYN